MEEELIGRTFGHCKIVSLLGKGGMGAVYKARDTTLQRDVAIKVMNPQIASQPNIEARFLQEARTAARLKHPNIVQVFDFNQEGSLFYIVMEFIPGKTLEQMFADLRSRSKWIVLSEAVQVIRQLSLAIDYAHRQGVLHRDIKPSNIMIEPVASEGLPFRPILTDLGLAKLAEGGVVTQVGISLGTPAYMSPEAALGMPTDARSDVYSLGVLLFEMATGQLPFPAKTITEAVRYHTKQPPPTPRSIRSDVPEPLERIILKALEKDPANRYSDGAALAQALEAASPRETKIASTPVAAGGAVSLMTQYQAVESDARGQSILQEFGTPAQSRQDRIQVLTEGKTTHSVIVKSDTLIVGRGTEADIVLNDPKISRQHARIEFDGKNYRVVDLDSTNGTFMANAKLLPGVPEVWLPDKVLHIGNFYLHLQPATRAPAAAPSPVTSVISPQGPKAELSGVQSVTGQRVSLHVEKNDLTVEPGQCLQLIINLLNQGVLVEHFQTSIEGIPSSWLPAGSPVVQLLPGDQQAVSFTISPPRTPQSRAGTYPITIKVTSQDGRNQAAVPGSLTVTPYSSFTSELRPQKIRAGRAARLKVDNQGNSPQVYSLTWQDPAVELVFKPSQAEMRVPEGQSAITEFRAAPRQRRWIGGQQIHPYTAQVTSEAGAVQAQSGNVVSHALIPPWVPPVVIMLCLLLVAAASLLFMNRANALKQATQTQLAMNLAATAAAETVIAQSDSDNDGLTNAEEIALGTDPNNPDTDGDGLKDGDEVKKYGTNPKNKDTDGDTLPDGQEVLGCTSPNNPDTDGDGINDNVDTSPCKLPTPTPTATVTPTPTPAPWMACPGYYQSRLRLGDRAYVSDNPPVDQYVHSEPGLDASTRIGMLKVKEQMEVLEGPKCVENMIWWKVHSFTSGLIGWTSEGDGKNYWLVPLPR